MPRAVTRTLDVISIESRIICGPIEQVNRGKLCHSDTLMTLSDASGVQSKGDPRDVRRLLWVNVSSGVVGRVPTSQESDHDEWLVAILRRFVFRKGRSQDCGNGPWG